jgi:hypothetical protein
MVAKSSRITASLAPMAMTTLAPNTPRQSRQTHVMIR